MGEVDGYVLLRALPPQYRLYRFKHNQQIEPQSHVFDVVQIELELFPRFGQCRSISVTNLRPPRQSRANHVTQIEVRNLLSEPGHELRPFRPWSNKPHIAAKHIPQLRHLIEARLAHEHPYSCYPRIVFGSPFGACDLRIGAHRTKLVDLEVSAAQADAGLHEEDGSRRGETHHQHDEREEREKEQQANSGSESGHNTPRDLLRGLHPESFAIDKAAGMKPIQVKLAGQPFEQAACIFDDDSIE